MSFNPLPISRKTDSLINDKIKIRSNHPISIKASRNDNSHDIQTLLHSIFCIQINSNPFQLNVAHRINSSYSSNGATDEFASVATTLSSVEAVEAAIRVFLLDQLTINNEINTQSDQGGSFMMTVTDGNRYYATFRIFENKVLIAVSLFPIISFIKQMFNALGLERGEDLPFLLNSLCHLPILPVNGLTYDIQFPSKVLHLQFSPLEEIEDEELDAIILRILTPSMMIQAWKALVLEQKVLVISKFNGIIFACCEFFRKLTLPMHFVNMYVPILPRELIHAIEAPFPYLIGTNKEYVLKHGADLSDIVVIDLDERTVSSTVQRFPFDSSKVDTHLQTILYSPLDQWFCRSSANPIDTRSSRPDPYTASYASSTVTQLLLAFNQLNLTLMTARHCRIHALYRVPPSPSSPRIHPNPSMESIRPSLSAGLASGDNSPRTDIMGCSYHDGVYSGCLQIFKDKKDGHDSTQYFFPCWAELDPYALNIYEYADDLPQLFLPVKEFLQIISLSCEPEGQIFELTIRHQHQTKYQFSSSDTSSRSQWIVAIQDMMKRYKVGIPSLTNVLDENVSMRKNSRDSPSSKMHSESKASTKSLVLDESHPTASQEAIQKDFKLSQYRLPTGNHSLKLDSSQPFDHPSNGIPPPPLPHTTTTTTNSTVRVVTAAPPLVPPDGLHFVQALTESSRIQDSDSMFRYLFNQTQMISVFRSKLEPMQFESILQRIITQSTHPTIESYQDVMSTTFQDTIQLNLFRFEKTDGFIEELNTAVEGICHAEGDEEEGGGPTTTVWKELIEMHPELFEEGDLHLVQQFRSASKNFASNPMNSSSISRSGSSGFLNIAPTTTTAPLHTIDSVTTTASVRSGLPLGDSMKGRQSLEGGGLPVEGLPWKGDQIDLTVDPSKDLHGKVSRENSSDDKLSKKKPPTAPLPHQDSIGKGRVIRSMTPTMMDNDGTGQKLTILKYEMNQLIRTYRKCQEEVSNLYLETRTVAMDEIDQSQQLKKLDHVTYDLLKMMQLSWGTKPPQQAEPFRRTKSQLKPIASTEDWFQHVWNIIDHSEGPFPHEVEGQEELEFTSPRPIPAPYRSESLEDVLRFIDANLDQLTLLRVQSTSSHATASINNSTHDTVATNATVKVAESNPSNANLISLVMNPSPLSFSSPVQYNWQSLMHSSGSSGGFGESSGSGSNGNRDFGNFVDINYRHKIEPSEPLPKNKIEAVPQKTCSLDMKAVIVNYLASQIAPHFDMIRNQSVAENHGILPPRSPILPILFTLYGFTLQQQRQPVLALLSYSEGGGLIEQSKLMETILQTWLDLIQVAVHTNTTIKTTATILNDNAKSQVNNAIIHNNTTDREVRRKGSLDVSSLVKSLDLHPKELKIINWFHRLHPLITCQVIRFLTEIMFVQRMSQLNQLESNHTKSDLTSSSDDKSSEDETNHRQETHTRFGNHHSTTLKTLRLPRTAAGYDGHSCSSGGMGGGPVFLTHDAMLMIDGKLSDKKGDSESQSKSSDTDSIDDSINLQKLIKTAASKVKNSEYQAGEILYRQALVLCDKLYGMNSLEAAEIFEPIAMILIQRNEIIEAESYLKRCLMIREGEQTLSFSHLLYQYAECLYKKNRFEEAIGTFHQVLILRQQFPSPHHVDVLNASDRLGLCLLENEQFVEAEKIIQENFLIRKKIKNDLGIFSSQLNLGHYQLAKGLYKEAELTYQEVLSGREKLLGGHHPDTLRCIRYIGDVYRQSNRFDDAEALYRQVWSEYLLCHEENHPDNLSTMTGLAIILMSKRKYEEAEELLVKCIHGYEVSMSWECPDKLQAIQRLGMLYSLTSKFEKAELYYKRALAGREVILGGHHVETLNSVNSLGSLLKAMNQLGDAEELLLRALAGFEKLFGKKHRKTCDIAFDLAQLYNKLYLLSNASEMFRYAYQGYCVALGPQHSRSIEAKRNMERMTSSRKKTTTNVDY